MAQGSFVLRNMPGQNAEDGLPKYLDSDYSFQSNLDYLKCVESLQTSTTIKRLSLKRRPRVALNNVEPTLSDASSSQWHSAESLLSSSDDSRLLAVSSTRGRPPLPPSHGSSLDNKACRIEGPTTSHMESKPQPPARSHILQKQSSLDEKNIVETHRYLQQEAMSQPPPQPLPRRRLASFGGVSSPGSLSPFTGLGAYNQNNNGNKPAGTSGDIHAHLSASLGSRGSTGSLKLSPQSSGRSTPVTSLGSMHLQHVRDQMVVALQRLKELEEQVKIIPVLKVKISVLQEEKRLLVCELKNQNDSEDINVSVSTEELGDTVQNDCINFKEFRQLTKEMQALERTIKGGHLQGLHGKSSLHSMSTRSVAVGTDEDIDTKSNRKKENKYAYTEQEEMRCIATQVCEDNLGIYTERDAELDAQQLIIGSLKEKMCYLEAELKESTLQTEMSRLKLELQAAGARNRADKASTATPSTASTSTEARPHTKSQGVGNHIELRDASTGIETEMKTVGVSCCRSELKNVSIGPDVPMTRWVVREQVETREKSVGVQVLTTSQGVGPHVKVCDAETNTEVPVENLGFKKGVSQCRSVACGDCSVNVIVSETKEVVSHGIATDPVKGIDLGIMAAPQTASQRTNTVCSSVSRFTNTRQAFNTDSSTNTILSTQDKHTNTPQTVTRTVSVGNVVRDVKCTPKTRTVGVGTAIVIGSPLKQSLNTVSVATRDTGVGFTNIYENYLVGLKTRNMASGPSHLPDPIKTRSVGVGEGRIWDFSNTASTPSPVTQPSTQSQWDPELNHYIEKLQRFLRDHQDLLTEDSTEQREGFIQPQCSQETKSSTKSSNNKVETHGGTEVHPLDSYPSAANREVQAMSQHSDDPSRCDKSNQGICQQSGSSDVKRMIQMLEQQTSSAMQDRSTNGSVPRAVMKKKSSDHGCSNNRKSMKFMRVTTGLEPVKSQDLSVTDKVFSEEMQKKGASNSRELPQEGAQARKGRSGTNKGPKGSGISHTPQRFKFSEKMLSACQALKMHLVDDKSLSSRDLHDSLQTLQQEWFFVSSQKAAVPDTVEDYLSAFRVISPSVLQHIANMADGNGNTALHYSVSHSNFGVVKKLLDAEVCNVNQQNKAGYTPIMLAALAAVDSPEDMRVVKELFTKGDVNAKASQAGQTALMLAVSHGRMDMVQALLAQGAQVNLQDDEGSTALMCASEHGHVDIVKLLLVQPDCDATLTDSDESTALSIALEAGHNEIAMLLYAHANFSKGQTGAAARLCGKSLPSPGGKNIFE
ncbi:KN motif and ankyrin repeat domain-containing protein 1-like [Sphaeramia orbicularis]|uniref:KN motif and ankyrin repeat domain-containing protein 1-like n=1 Tax=Sphaeramia orbicularis TaxID=375764 RepID=UPI0011800116|nr:KN motif and ankyrin repeat domain-containing protein 1-like [Sphaeramia orbicularis]